MKVFKRLNNFHNHIKKIFSKLIPILILPTVVLSQNENVNQIANRLISAGFENVQVAEHKEQLFVAYENRVYRFEIRAIKEMLKMIADECNKYNQINLLIQNKKIPIATISISSIDLKNWSDKIISDSLFAGKMTISVNESADFEKYFTKEEFQNSSNMKFDLVLKPTYRFQFGIYSDPVLYQLNFAPHLEFSLWKGMSALYELTIPIHNDFAPREDSIRTSMISINQTFRISNTFLLSTSVGYFSQNRYGFDIEARGYFGNGNLSLGVNLGYTGYANFSASRLYYSDLYLWTGAASLELRIPEYDLTLGLMAGKFLLKDNTIRVDIYRDFGEIQIGFFALRSTKGILNGGFNFSVPLFPSKHWNPTFLRVRTVENLSYSYSVKTDIDDLIGLRYNTGFRLNNFYEKINPSFVKNIFSKRLN
jgi:hypothetical protein